MKPTFATLAVSLGATGLLVLGTAMSPSASAATTVAPAGPQPYAATTPQYTPMKKEPVLDLGETKTALSLGSVDGIDGPAAGPQPYHAPTPAY